MAKCRVLSFSSHPILHTCSLPHPLESPTHPRNDRRPHGILALASILSADVHCSTRYRNEGSSCAYVRVCYLTGEAINCFRHGEHAPFFSPAQQRQHHPSGPAGKLSVLCQMNEKKQRGVYIVVAPNSPKAKVADLSNLQEIYKKPVAQPTR
ncbi:hypothetical protein MPH_01098 [Macrophomina phaseolina MS6]|uniref:Uncharacterized protein n=1 Tax=Macrophomina phaseolina (strain MS6) TaxID=1126212 RepID=K2SYF0_MACPH|nr:hypothetical protein MPH_01098 [Macrophomina phaseolina MS6]